MMDQMTLSLVLLRDEYVVCKLDVVPSLDWDRPSFLSLTKTADEISLVCRVMDIPPVVTADAPGCVVNAPWRCFRIAGTLDFALTGILSRISAVLAGAGVSIFAVSTYDTDYILVPSAWCGHAAESLAAAGYAVSVE